MLVLPKCTIKTLLKGFCLVAFCFCNIFLLIQLNGLVRLCFPPPFYRWTLKGNAYFTRWIYVNYARAIAFNNDIESYCLSYVIQSLFFISKCTFQVNVALPSSDSVYYIPANNGFAVIFPSLSLFLSLSFFFSQHKMLALFSRTNSIC